MTTIHPIEAESYRILHERVDLSAWPGEQRAVVARVIHATADIGFASSMRIGDRAVPAALAALRSGAPVVCDANMLRVGLSRRGSGGDGGSPTQTTGSVPARSEAVCLLDEVGVAPEGSTRSAAAFALAAERYPNGALWVVGNAPTALEELLRLTFAGRLEPAAVVGLPVGFVGAKEAKARLWASALQPLAITNVGERGGTPAAAAAVNTLLREDVM